MTRISTFFRRAALPITVLLLALSSGAQAQQTDRTEVIPCQPARAVPPCIDLDASRSVDAKSGPLTYRWDMGDSTILTGPVVSHCYKRRRSYTIQLDVVEPSGYVRSAEKVIPVDFTKETVLYFAMPDTVRVGQTVAFNASEAYLPCENVVVLWDFRDGMGGQGRQASHVFRRAGTYTVRMSLRGNGSNGCTNSHCGTRELVVLP